MMGVNTRNLLSCLDDWYFMTSSSVMYFCRLEKCLKILFFRRHSQGFSLILKVNCSRPVPEVVITVVRAPDDGCQHPKHVEVSIDM